MISLLRRAVYDLRLFLGDAARTQRPAPERKDLQETANQAEAALTKFNDAARTRLES